MVDEPTPGEGRSDGAGSVSAEARRVMLIRHAEKPHGGVFGTKPNGRKSTKSLTARGWQRAGALVGFFQRAPDWSFEEQVSTPKAIYASRVEAHEESRRPQRTVRPLAERLGIGVDHHFGHDAERRLVDAIKEVIGPVLVCWHHEGIPALARIIAPDVTLPKNWPGERFDIVWVLDLKRSGADWTFRQVPQMLLAGDMDTVLPLVGS